MSTLAAPPTDESSVPPRSRWQAAVVWVLAVAIALATASAIVSWRADDQLYEPDLLLAAFEDLPDDPERAEELAVWIAEETIRSLRLEDRLNELLPFGAGVITGPVISGLEGIAIRISTQLVRTELFAQIWADALPGVYEQVALLREGSEEGLLTTDGQAIVVDLDRAILASYDLIADAIPDIPDDSLFAQITGVDTAAIKDAIGNFIEGALPDDLTGFPLIGAETLDQIEKWESQLRLILWVSLATMIAAAAAAIVFEPRRSLAVGAVAGALLVGIGIGVLSVARIETAIVDALRDLPWVGGGPGVDTVLDWWTALVIVALLLSLAPFVAKLVGGRAPAPGRHGPAGLKR